MFERSIKYGKKIPKDSDKKLSDFLAKVKKGNLSKEEKLSPQLPKEVQDQI